jgi:hypothetical protein
MALIASRNTISKTLNLGSARKLAALANAKVLNKAARKTFVDARPIPRSEKLAVLEWVLTVFPSFLVYILAPADAL